MSLDIMQVASSDICDSSWKVHMSSPCNEDSTPTDPRFSMASRQKISANLSSDTSSPEFQSTLRWVIFKIVQANKGITFVRIKQIMRGEYGITDKRLLDAAISSMTSPTLLNCLTKWHNPRMKDAGTEIGIHLYARPDDCSSLRCWLETTAEEFPELAHFVPPVRETYPSRNTRRKAEAR